MLVFSTLVPRIIMMVFFSLCFRVLRLLYYGETSLDEHFGQCLDVLASLQFPLHKMVVEVKTKSNVTSFIKAISGNYFSYNNSLLK